MYCYKRKNKSLKKIVVFSKKAREAKDKLTTPWLKMKKTNRQIIVHKKQHRKLKKKNINIGVTGRVNNLILIQLSFSVGK